VVIETAFSSHGLQIAVRLAESDLLPVIEGRSPPARRAAARAESDCAYSLDVVEPGVPRRPGFRQDSSQAAGFTRSACGTDARKAPRVRT
jgi:hypothetical protein